jgi:hypothetical protein
MARGGTNSSASAPLDAGEPIPGSMLPRADDEDLARALDAAYGVHVASCMFEPATISLTSLSMMSFEEFESSDYWCEVCAEEAEDDDEVAEIVLACQIERRQIIEEYLDQFAAGAMPEAIVVEATDTGWRILDGYHRACAAKAAGLDQIAAYVLTDEDAP